MAQQEGDFEKGDYFGSLERIELIKEIHEKNKIIILYET